MFLTHDFMEKTYNLDSICSVIQQDWRSLRPALHTTIESIYASIGLQSGLFLHDRHYYLSALYTITRMVRPRHTIHIGTSTDCAPLAVALALRDYSISGTIDGINSPCEENEPKAHLRPTVIEQLLHSAHLAQYAHFHFPTPHLSASPDAAAATPPNILRTFIERKLTHLVIIDAEQAIDGIFRDIDKGGRTLHANGPSIIFVYNHLSVPGIREALFYWKRLHAASILFREFSEHDGFSIIQYYKGVAIDPKLGAPQHIFSF